MLLNSYITPAHYIFYFKFLFTVPLKMQNNNNKKKTRTMRTTTHALLKTFLNGFINPYKSYVCNQNINKT